MLRPFREILAEIKSKGVVKRGPEFSDDARWTREAVTAADHGAGPA